MISKPLANILIFLFLFFSSSVYAQIDIQSTTPTPAQTTTGSTQTVSGYTPPCITIDQLKNKVKVKNIITGQRKDGEWYSIKKNANALTAKKLFNNIDRIANRTGIGQNPDRQYAGSDQNAEGVLRRNEDIQGDLQTGSLSQNDEQCAVRISGYSPSIFIYSTNTRVQPLVTILYLEQNNQYLYYEYDSTNISFSKPKEGWIIDKEKLKAFSQGLSNKLQLTPLESERLLFELNFSAADVKSDKLFIGLIPQQEIDQKLPLEISSSNTPEVLRYHFYVASANNNLVKPSILVPIQRGEFFILEFGSWLEK